MSTVNLQHGDVLTRLILTSPGLGRILGKRSAPRPLLVCGQGLGAALSERNRIEVKRTPAAAAEWDPPPPRCPLLQQVVCRNDGVSSATQGAASTRNSQ